MKLVIPHRPLHGLLPTLAATLALMTHAPSPANAVSIELKDAAPDRIERQRKAAIGQLPLPGTPNISQRDTRLTENNLKIGSEVFVRIFKEESELELWMRRGETFVLFATYPICNWSGGLGPKLFEGDRQAPEGFYTVTRRQLRRGGRWPQSLNLGFPNVFDRAQARTGSYILVHGGCSSIGCFAMTNPVIEEIYELVSAAIKAGQQHTPVHVLPFRMTPANLKRHENSQWTNFWKNLKQGYDSFERTRRPPRVNVCENQYQFRDTAPWEVGAQNPLAVCGKTAARAKAFSLLADVVNQPHRWKTLTASENALLKNLARLSARHRRMAEIEAKSELSFDPRRAKLARRRSKSRRAIALTCSLKRASCRKHMALKHRAAGARSRAVKKRLRAKLRIRRRSRTRKR